MDLGARIEIRARRLKEKQREQADTYSIALAPAHQLQRPRIIRPRCFSHRFQGAIGLVDDDHICNLHDPTLDALQLIAPCGGQQQDEDIRHFGYHGFGLSDADGFDQHRVIARCLDQPDCFPCAPGHATQRAAGRRRSNKCAGMTGQLLHPGFVPQNRTARPARRRIDSQNGDFVPCLDQF